jgi:hypothetical protein
MDEGEVRGAVGMPRLGIRSTVTPWLYDSSILLLLFASIFSSPASGHISIGMTVLFMCRLGATSVFGVINSKELH